MATVLHRTTKQLITSANTPDFPEADWIINPDMSAVSSFPPKYWIITGNTVSLMSKPERDALDVTNESARKDAAASNLDELLLAVVKALNNGSFVPGSNYDGATLKSIIKGEL